MDCISLIIKKGVNAMYVKILTNGGYGEEFNVTIGKTARASRVDSAPTLAFIKIKELRRLGAVIANVFRDDESLCYYIGEECEVIKKERSQANENDG
jgi:hypothetical protein